MGRFDLLALSCRVTSVQPVPFCYYFISCCYERNVFYYLFYLCIYYDELLVWTGCYDNCCCCCCFSYAVMMNCCLHAGTMNCCFCELVVVYYAQCCYDLMNCVLWVVLTITTFTPRDSAILSILWALGQGRCNIVLRCWSFYLFLLCVMSVVMVSVCVLYAMFSMPKANFPWGQ